MDGQPALRPESGVAPLRLESFLPYQLNLVASEVSQALAAIYGARFGISVPEWRVLATLGQFEQITAREIGEHSRMHKTTVSRAVVALEKRGCVARRTNTEDMREAFLTLTEAGRAIYLDILPLARRFADELCRGLSESERAQLNTLLSRLSSRIGEMAGGGDGADRAR
jgi:DNA-binding MarR family transcriptional regulator